MSNLFRAVFDWKELSSWQSNVSQESDSVFDPHLNQFTQYNPGLRSDVFKRKFREDDSPESADQQSPPRAKIPKPSLGMDQNIVKRERLDDHKPVNPSDRMNDVFGQGLAQRDHHHGLNGDAYPSLPGNMASGGLNILSSTCFCYRSSINWSYFGLCLKFWMKRNLAEGLAFVWDSETVQYVLLIYYLTSSGTFQIFNP